VARRTTRRAYGVAPVVVVPVVVAPVVVRPVCTRAVDAQGRVHTRCQKRSPLEFERGLLE
jgi:hypothetical protein